VILATDSFDRADAATLGVNWPLLKGESQHLGIFSNQVDTSAAGDCGNAYDGGISWPGDQWAEAPIATIGTGETLIWVRGEAFSGSTKNGYQGGTDDGNLGHNNTEIIKRVADTWSELGSSGVNDITAGSVVRVEAEGNAVRVLVDGVQKVAVTDASFSGGNPGLSAIHAVNVGLFTSFTAGDFTPEEAVPYYRQNRSTVPPNVRMT